jgi:hypothetical protein
MAEATAIDRLFHAMCSAGASDLHLSVESPPIIRKDGRMQPLEPGAAPFGVDDLVSLLTHLDPPTADALTADLLDTVSGEGGAGLLLITHRLTGLQRVDEVVVLEAGRVLERGTHDELLTAGGRYAQRWRREQAVPSGPPERFTPTG